jgi:hypothetical protein
MTSPFWLQLHADNLVRFCARQRRILPALLALYIFLLLSFTIITMQFPYIYLDEVSNLDSLQNYEVVQFVRMVLGYSIAEWMVNVLSVGILLIWLVMAFFAYFITQILLEPVWQLFYPTDPNFYATYCRMTRFTHAAFGRKRCILDGIGIVIILCTLFELRIWTGTPDRAVNLAGCMFLGIVPYVYAFIWAWYIRILARHPRAGYLNLYLFSQHTARRKLKGAVDLLVFFALLSWFLLPTYFYVCKSISETVAFSVREILDEGGEWTALMQKIKFESPDHKERALPAPNQLEERLNPIVSINDSFPIAKASPTMLMYLFAVVMFATFLELSIPATYNAVRTRGYQVTLRRVLVATMKTTVFLAALQFFVIKAYFIDMSEILGLGAMFAFIIAFAIAQDEHFYKKWKKPYRNSSSEG